MSRKDTILYLDGVSVSFDGFKAIDNLSLVLAQGEMRAIIGPNGAGKTTMMDIITGKTRPDAGDGDCDGDVDLTRSIFPALLHRSAADQSERIDEILNVVRLAARRHELAANLSHGQKQWLEIGMLLAQDPKLLLVDEPVAGMTDAETEETARLLKEIARSHSVVVVEHDMHFVRELGVKVTCLHEGSVLSEGTLDFVSADERVVEVYLGR